MELLHVFYFYPYLLRWLACLKIIKLGWIIYVKASNTLHQLRRISTWTANAKFPKMMRWSHAFVDRWTKRTWEFSILISPITVEKDVSIVWCQLNVTMTHVIVESFVPIVDFKNINTLMFTLYLKEVRVGVFAQAKRSFVVVLLCSILVNFFQQTLSSARLESNNTVNLLAHIWWRHLRVRWLILLIRVT